MTVEMVWVPKDQFDALAGACRSSVAVYRGDLHEEVVRAAEALVRSGPADGPKLWPNQIDFFIEAADEILRRFTRACDGVQETSQEDAVDLYTIRRGALVAALELPGRS